MSLVLVFLLLFCCFMSRNTNCLSIHSYSYKIKATSLSLSSTSTFESAANNGDSTSSTSTTAKSVALPYLEERRPLKTAILAIAARTVRGQVGTKDEMYTALDLVAKLESFNPTPKPFTDDLIYGNWELIFTNTNLFRSSPFFMAARAVCKDGEEADRFNTFCDLHRDALSFTNVGKVTQIITRDDELISEFQTTVPVIPGLPIQITGTIQSMSTIMRANDYCMIIMDTVKIKQDTSNIPFLNTFLNDFEGLPIKALGKLLSNSISSYRNPQPIFRTKYVDTHMRISRDQDDNVFVYSRVV